MIDIWVDLSKQEVEAIQKIAEAEGLAFNEACNMLLDIGIDEFRRAPIRKIIGGLIREGLRMSEKEK